MNKEDTQKDHAYKWIILLLAFLIQLLFNLMIFQIGGFAGSLMQDLKLQSNQLAMLLSVSMLTAAIFGIPAGALADRFGVKRVVLIGLMISSISAFGRITAGSFIALFVWMLLLGFGGACLNANISKFLGAWFDHKQMGMAMGVYVAAAGLGITIALVTSPLFPSVQTAFTVSGTAMLLITVLWLLFAKNKPAGVPDPPVQPKTNYLGVAAKSKNIWIGSLAIFFMMGTYVTHSGFLSNALIEAKGIDPVQAGFVASSFTLAFIVGGVAGPAIANKAGVFRPFLAPTAILCAISTYLAWNVSFGTLTYVFLIIAGLMVGTSVPIVMSLPMALPEIGPVYAGSAGGIISTMQNAGAFVISSYIITPLAGSDMNKVFLYIAVGYFLYGIAMLFLPEVGPKTRTKKTDIVES